MLTPIFRKTIFISLLSHFTAFSIFSFSFGRVMPQAGAGRVNFWGQFLRASQVSRPVPPVGLSVKKDKFFRRAHYPPAPKQQTGGELGLLSGYFLKPPAGAAYSRGKISPIYKAPALPPVLRKEPRQVIFHPLLPYNFTLYFTDRQVAHVELAFKLSPSATGNTFEVRRRISSGNLEVDLLSMRYIWHYLFVQRPNLPVDAWQTVKIDLSQKE